MPIPIHLLQELSPTALQYIHIALIANAYSSN